MKLVKTIKMATIGAVAGVAFVFALPVFGGVGAITAAGAAIGSVVGALAGVYDSINEG
jgi:hypothetical protein